MINMASNTPAASRRNFLQKIMLLMTGNAVIHKSNAAQLYAPATTKPDIATKQPSSSGYHETEHIRNYYKSAGL